MKVSKAKLYSLTFFYYLVWGSYILYLFYFIVSRLKYSLYGSELLFFTLPVDTFIYLSILFILLTINSIIIIAEYFMKRNLYPQLTLNKKLLKLTLISLIIVLSIYIHLIFFLKT